MQLHFIWIDDFKYFQEKSINLSAQYEFSFRLDAEEGIWKGYPDVKYNPDYIPGFFEEPNITNVTAIIGKNGAGKSTILDYIKSHLPEGLEAGLSRDLIVYSLDDQYGKTINYILYPYSWKLEVSGIKEDFVLQSYSDSILLPGSIRDDSSPSDAEYIYYSYILDMKQEATDWKGLFNLSTTALIEETRRAMMAEVDGDQAVNRSITDLECLIGNELSKTVQLLISEYRYMIPFPYPDSLSILVDHGDEDYFRNQKDEKHGDIKELLKKINDKLLDHTMNEDFYRQGLDELCKAILINFFLTERKYSQLIVPNHIYNIGKNESIRDFVLRFFNHLAAEKLTLSGGASTYPITRYIELSEAVPRFITLFEELVNKHLIGFDEDRYSSISYRFVMTEEADKAFDHFFKLYLQIKGISPFLAFRWRGLSTGEQSFLSFMARFVHLKRHQIGNDQLRKNLVIMIDEGDAGFHPEWQKQFFKHSLNFLSSLFNEHQLQLIYTANAPFLTSDLTKPHIIFLNKSNASGTTVLGKENDRMPTFGANIHQLYQDSFYVSGALIGDFAKSKINRIIEFLNDKRVSRPDEKLRRIIDQIGEPLIKQKLLSMWSEKFETEDEIAVLEKRLKQLKADKKKKGTQRK